MVGSPGKWLRGPQEARIAENQRPGPMRGLWHNGSQVNSDTRESTLASQAGISLSHNLYKSVHLHTAVGWKGYGFWTRTNLCSLDTSLLCDLGHVTTCL